MWYRTEDLGAGTGIVLISPVFDAGVAGALFLVVASACRTTEIVLRYSDGNSLFLHPLNMQPNIKKPGINFMPEKF